AGGYFRGRRAPRPPFRAEARRHGVLRPGRPGHRVGRAVVKTAVGIDFGTESGRAILVDLATGAELATAVHQYANGVIDQRLPSPHDDVVLEPDWALQDPADYIEPIRHTVPRLRA